MGERVTVFLEFDGEVADEEIEDLIGRVRALDAVGDGDAQIEEPERSGVEVIRDVTLTLTAVGGAFGAANMLLQQLKELLATVRGFRSAQVRTPEGDTELAAGGTPRNENPAQ